MKKTNAITLLLLTSLLLVSYSYTNSNEDPPMITRHDKDDSEFIKLAKQFEKYMCHINLPDCEGAVIADQWAITAAHCAIGIAQNFEEGQKHFVIINNTEIEVDKVIMYKEWDNIEENLSILEDPASLNDIALLHLKTKPDGVLKAKLYLDEDEVDKLIYMAGRGNKGNGLNGVSITDWKQRGATNRIETATEKWLTWTFDHSDTKTKYLTEYEGISGPGDSGGPAFIVKNDVVYLAGVSSWQDRKGGSEGLYGVVENYTRVSQYIEWINDEMTGNGSTSKAMLRIEPKPDAVDYRPKAIAIDPSTLKKYVGEYEIKRTTIKIYTEENSTKLYLYVQGQPPHELVPTGKHEFSFKVLAGFTLKFQNLENGVFKEYVGTQPQSTYTAIRK